MQRPVTATEVQIRMKESTTRINTLARIIGNTIMIPLINRMVKMYNMYEGRKRTDWYWLHVIKTM